MPHDPPHDPPADDVLDEPLIGVKINQHWMSHVIGLASEITRQSYWASDQERGEEQAIEMLDILAKGNAEVFDHLSARIHRSSSQSVPHNISTTITFDTAIWDVGGLWSPAAPTNLSLPEIGIWDVGACVRWSANLNGDRSLSPRLSSGPTYITNRLLSQGGDFEHAISGQVIVTAPDALQLRVRQTSGVSISVTVLGNSSIDLWATYLGPL